MTIAIPTGIKIFNWLGTMWQGRIQLDTPMLFAIGFVAMFTIGGLSGVTHAVVPSDWQQTDTYYIVAHFHYVLFGGAIFGLFGGLYYWFPKLTGRVMSDKLGKIHFWLMFIGFNLTFAPMHWLGLQGMVRRTWKYAPETGLEPWNVAVTVGAFIIAISIAVFIFNWYTSRRKGELSGLDPWDARTVEWMITQSHPRVQLRGPAGGHQARPLLASQVRRRTRTGGPCARPDADEILAGHRVRGAQPGASRSTSPTPPTSRSSWPWACRLMFYGIIYHDAAWGKALIVVGVPSSPWWR